MTLFLTFRASHSFGAKRFFEGLLDVPEGCRGVFLGAFGVCLGVKQKYFEKILRHQKPRNHAVKQGIIESFGGDFGSISSFSACEPLETSV